MRDRKGLVNSVLIVLSFIVLAGPLARFSFLRGSALYFQSCLFSNARRSEFLQHDDAHFTANARGPSTNGLAQSPMVPARWLVANIINVRSYSPRPQNLPSQSKKPANVPPGSKPITASQPHFGQEAQM